MYIDVSIVGPPSLAVDETQNDWLDWDLHERDELSQSMCFRRIARSRESLRGLETLNCDLSLLRPISASRLF